MIMKSQCGMLKEECGLKTVEVRFAPMFPTQHPASSIQHPRPRRAVTLVELLITMTIMAIISAAVLGTAAAAIESGREKKTQSQIAKIHTLLMEHYASYETRRIDVDPRIVQEIDKWVAATVAGSSNPQQAFREASTARGQMLADARLLGLRELMKKEMPDRQKDVEHLTLILSQPPPLAQTYYRRFQQLQSAGESLSPAECLYLVVMNATGDGEARTLFAKQDIGDVDDDGAPEFVDGWGNSIGWIRWPAGVVSDLQPKNPDGSRPGETDHDPFDLFRRDSPTVTNPPIGSYPDKPAGQANVSFRTTYQTNMRSRMALASPTNSRLLAFRLTPLVFSGGPDGDSAMRIAGDADTSNPLDPYYVTPDDYQAGEPTIDNPDAVKDNITNHLLEY
jgi:prepilin-type N-terminal cleavage/methylation domain-containing protein